MRTISKGVEPGSLVDWKRANPRKEYADLTPDIRRVIREQALKEQYYLCAYCCQRISGVDACHNEHVEAQNLNRGRTLDFANIVASCNTHNQCGDAHQSHDLPLTPLMPECETELRFKISGRVEGLSDRAVTSIRVLNLGDNEKNNRALVEKRKWLSSALLLKNGISSNEELEDEELLKILISELKQPQGGLLEPFSPVAINILESWLKS